MEETGGIRVQDVRSDLGRWQCKADWTCVVCKTLRAQGSEGYAVICTEEAGAGYRFKMANEIWEGNSAR